MSVHPIAQDQFEVYAGYHQFYLQDAHPAGSTGSPDFWTEAAHQRMLATNPGIIGVGTESYGTVSVTVIHYAAEPPCQLDQWDHVTAASLDLAHGELQVIGCPDELAGRMAVPPGVYRVRICAAGLDTVVDEVGNDYYQIDFWPMAELPLEVIKQWRAF